MLNNAEFGMGEKRMANRRHEDELIEVRLSIVERSTEQNAREHQKIVDELYKVSQQTKSVADNTAEIVTIFKGIASLRTAILFGAPFVTALVGLLGAMAWLAKS